MTNKMKKHCTHMIDGNGDLLLVPGRIVSHLTDDHDHDETKGFIGNGFIKCRRMLQPQRLVQFNGFENYLLYDYLLVGFYDTSYNLGRLIDRLKHSVAFSSDPYFYFAFFRGPVVDNHRVTTALYLLIEFDKSMTMNQSYNLILEFKLLGEKSILGKYFNLNGLQNSLVNEINNHTMVPYPFESELIIYNCLGVSIPAIDMDINEFNLPEKYCEGQLWQ